MALAEEKEKNYEQMKLIHFEIVQLWFFTCLGACICFVVSSLLLQTFGSGAPMIYVILVGSPHLRRFSRGEFPGIQITRVSK